MVIFLKCPAHHQKKKWEMGGRREKTQIANKKGTIIRKYTDIKQIIRKVTNNSVPVNLTFHMGLTCLKDANYQPELKKNWIG